MNPTNGSTYNSSYGPSFNYRKLIIWLICILAIASFAAYWFFGRSQSGDIINIERAQLGPSAGPIIAFGDSLVYGIGASQRGNSSSGLRPGEAATKGTDLVSVLGNEIDEQILNYGKSGDTTEAALTRLDSMLEKKPRLVIVLLGGNDYLKQVPSETTFINLNTIVKKIQSTGAAVLVLGVRGGLLQDNFEDLFRDFTKTELTGYIPDVLDGLIGNRTYMSDAIHPNDAGYRRIADRVLPLLKDMVGK